MTAGRLRLGAGEGSRAAKAKRRRHHRQALLLPCPEIVIPRQRFVVGSQVCLRPRPWLSR